MHIYPQGASVMDETHGIARRGRGLSKVCHSERGNSPLALVVSIEAEWLIGGRRKRLIRSGATSCLLSLPTQQQQ